MPNETLAPDSDAPVPECPDCGRSDFETVRREEVIRYGKTDPVPIPCFVPTNICSNCGCEWTGSEAEDLRHDAVCRHLGRLTPEEVLAIRVDSGLSQAEFSEVTGFGEASLSRWETGAQIQNAACDRMLRLLRADDQNLDFLRQLRHGLNRSTAPRFRVIELTPELRARQRSFVLRRTG
jgi:putative zinc finger/helix-turn-helix YgiT family protein